MNPRLLQRRRPGGHQRGWLFAAFSVSGLTLALWTLRGQGACSEPTLVRQIQPVEPEPQALTLQQSFRRVAERVKPAVVSITTVHTQSVEVSPFLSDPFEQFFERFQGRPGTPPSEPKRFEHRFEGIGSGVVIDARGYILTNEHVVSEAEEIRVTVTSPEEREYKGRVLGKDPTSDLAVVKIEPKQELPYLSMGDSSKVEVGDWAVAVGSPFGLEQTVTVGVISAVRQSFRVGERVYANFLQTDAAINRGNSGGPLVNIRGEIIGVNTAIVGPAGAFAGIGFAIPSNHAKYIMDQLIQRGRVVRGWMGVEILPVDEVTARQFGLPEKKGALVNLVAEGSPADKAGIQRGDVIVSFGSREVESPEELIEEVTKTAPRTRVSVRVFRDGKPRDLVLVTAEKPIEPGERPAQAAEEEAQAPSQGWQGASLRGTSPALNRRAGIPPAEKGVMVAGIQPGSAAQQMGLQPGDLIVSLNRKPTPDLRAFLRAAKEADLGRGVLLDVNRGGRRLYLSYRKQ